MLVLKYGEIHVTHDIILPSAGILVAELLGWDMHMLLNENYDFLCCLFV